MVLNFADSGTATTTASEASIFSQIILDALHACMIHLEAMTSTETFVVKVYVWDSADAVERQFQISTFTGVQASPSVLFDFQPSKRYRLSIQRTAGTDKQISYERYTIV